MTIGCSSPALDLRKAKRAVATENSFLAKIDAALDSGHTSHHAGLAVGRGGLRGINDSACSILSFMSLPPGLSLPNDISSVGSQHGSETDVNSMDRDSLDDISTDRLFEVLSMGSTKSTLMIRNVPLMYTREMLLAEWPNDGTYDFLYLPVSFGTRRNLSFAFVNFTSEAAAFSFMQQWQKKRLANFASRKPLNISFADVQGRNSNLLEWQRKQVKCTKLPRYQPLVFDDQGNLIDFVEALNELTRMTETIKFFGYTAIISL